MERKKRAIVLSSGVIAVLLIGGGLVATLPKTHNNASSPTVIQPSETMASVGTSKIIGQEVLTTEKTLAFLEKEPPSPYEALSEWVRYDQIKSYMMMKHIPIDSVYVTREQTLINSQLQQEYGKQYKSAMGKAGITQSDLNQYAEQVGYQQSFLNGAKATPVTNEEVEQFFNQNHLVDWGKTSYKLYQLQFPNAQLAMNFVNENRKSKAANIIENGNLVGNVSLAKNNVPLQFQPYLPTAQAGQLYGPTEVNKSEFLVYYVDKTNTPGGAISNTVKQWITNQLEQNSKGQVITNWFSDMQKEVPIHLNTISQKVMSSAPNIPKEQPSQPPTTGSSSMN